MKEKDKPVDPLAKAKKRAFDELKKLHPEYTDEYIWLIINFNEAKHEASRGKEYEEEPYDD